MLIHNIYQYAKNGNKERRYRSMRHKISTKGKYTIIAVILAVTGIFIYIWSSTVFINEMNYRKLAYASVNYDPGIIGWEEARVAMVRLKEEPCMTPPVFGAKINRCLLFLNGGYAVKVEMHTELDGLLGPVVLYFNPFTKQYVGGAPRF